MIQKIINSIRAHNIINSKVKSIKNTYLKIIFNFYQLLYSSSDKQVQLMSIEVSNFRKVLSLVSGCLIHMIFGSMYTLGTITPYIASHLYEKGDHKITIVDVSVCYPIMMVTQTLGIFISMIYLQFVLSMKVLCFLGVWGFVASVFLASFMNELWSFAIFYSGFFGLFVGLTYMIPIKNAYSYYPNRKGMSSGIIMMVYGVGPFIFNQVILKLVNPDNLPSNKNHIFPPEVALNFPNTLRVLSLIYFIIGTFGCLLFYPLKKQIQKTETKQGQQEHEYSIVLNEQKNQQPLLKQRQQQKPLEIIKNFFRTNQDKKNQIFKLWLTIYFSAIYAVFISYNYKEYGELIVNNDYFITLAGSFGCLANSVGRLFWCNLFDCFSFRTIMTILNSSLFCLCCICIFVRNQNIYMMTVTLTYFFSGTFYGIMPTQSVRILGDMIGTTLYPIIFSGFAFASISQFIIHKVVILNWGDAGFKGVFIGLLVFQLGSITFIHLFNYEYVNKQGSSRDIKQKEQIQQNLQYSHTN